MVKVADIAKGEDSPEQTYHAVLDLLDAHPDLDAIYNVAGGNEGLARAIRERGRWRDIAILTHEANRITGPLVMEGVIDYLIAQDPRELLARAVEIAGARSGERSRQVWHFDFGVYTRFNLPGYALQAMRSLSGE